MIGFAFRDFFCDRDTKTILENSDSESNMRLYLIICDPSLLSIYIKKIFRLIQTKKIYILLCHVKERNIELYFYYNEV